MRKGLSFVALMVAWVSQGSAATPTIPVRVDPRVELMCIVMRIAGAQEYNMPNSKSVYSDEVDKHFAPFKEHAAIKALLKMRAANGIGYDAPMSLTLHLDNVKDLKPLINLAHPPQTLDSRWKLEPTNDFLVKLRAFVKDTQFEEFFKQHEAYYKKATDSMQGLLIKYAFSDWFDRFYGPRTNAQLFATVGLLAGGGNYGVSAQIPNGKLVVSPVIGVWQFDSQGVPVFVDGQAFTLVHEFSHTYTNSLVVKNFDKFAKSANALFEANSDQFKSQAYSGGQTVAAETMVRVATVLFAKQCVNEYTGNRCEKEEINNGFWWVDGFVKLFDEYKDRKKYPTIEAFMPRIVEEFNEVPAQLPKLKARMPHVVSMTPENRSPKVSADTKQIQITFSQPVLIYNAKGVYWQSQKPLETGGLLLSEDKKTLTIPVKLEPGKTYRWMLYAVVTAEGYTPIPQPMSFTTTP